MHAFRSERAFELRLQNMLHRAHHEIDNRLRRIYDSVRIRNLHRKPLEELFIHGVEERLLLAPIGNGFRLHLQGAVKMIERREELLPRETPRSEQIGKSTR